MTTLEIQDHIMRHRPNLAYLGRKEMAGMITEYHRTTTATLSPDGYEDLHYCGCLLVAVGRESHIHFLNAEKSS